MSTASHDSGMELRIGPNPAGDPVAGEDSQAAECGIWLNGDVLSCACPECGVPMSIRLWLMVADCFRCGTSIELTEQQEQEALRLLRRHEEAKRAESRQAAAAITPSVLPKPKSPPAQKPKAPPPADEPKAAPPRAKPSAGRQPDRVAASQAHRGTRARMRKLYEKGGLAALWSDLFRNLPAWLISLVVHLIGLLLLSLWFASPSDNKPAITLSTSLSPDDTEGQQGMMTDPLVEPFEFEDPGARELPNTVDQPGAPSEDLLAEELPFQLPHTIAELENSAASELLPSPLAPVGRMLHGRDPRVRAHMVERAGGTSATEAAVSRGLKFLARHQNGDGSWSLENFNRTPDCDDTCNGIGQVGSNVAATALGLLPFLGAGQTHRGGEYSEEVRKGLQWLVYHQKKDGSLCDGGQMYAHGQAAIVLCEAYALTRDAELRQSAQMALDFIVRAQHGQGGWRYVPKEAGDTSVVGWQLMALKSGQMGYLRVPQRTFDQSGRFLNRVQVDGYGGRYTYQRGRRYSPAMTAEALLCRQYLGWPRKHAGLRAGVDYLLEHPPDPGKPNIYYWYYATQVMHHFGGEPWQQWNAKMSSTLVNTQETRGHAAGSWAPRGQGNEGGFADRGGRLYMTGLAICILEVYYRHMPIYGEAALAEFQLGGPMPQIED